MKKIDIISTIETRVIGYKYNFDHPLSEKEKYKCWYVGITNDPATRSQQHNNDKENVKHWKDWKADSENDARAIEQYFLDKGMRGGPGGGNPEDKPDYVYIF